MSVKLLRILWSLVAAVLAIIHFVRPTMAVDGVTCVLLFAIALPWLPPIFKSLQFPGGWKVEFSELQKAAQDQANATVHQTLATVITWVQAPEIREGRRQLFSLENTERISRLAADKWQDQWKQAADLVSQAFNSAAVIARQDTRLQEVWIRPTRRTILKTWSITQPRVRERRREQDDLWEHFEWLAAEARKYCKPGEEATWNTGEPA